MNAYVYILKSEKVAKTYVGSTTDLSRRIHEHNSGLSTFTKRHMPWKLVYSEECASIALAREREHYFKSAVGRRFLKNNNIIPR
ncbi:GIY-YIG nuclease family protein [Candidatus Kaiserbacteria bacterium]|nr:GIY-YIG nuclease family protein [Candidatus Kaiserbacteria bacterium]